MDAPPFEPHPLLRGAHAQTIAGTLSGGAKLGRGQEILVRLPDGDAVVLHDAAPPEWKPGGRAMLLIHGLCGDHTSPYMARVSARLRARGARTFCMDLRGAGAAAGLSKKLYHSGRSDDIAAAVLKISQVCPDSPICIIGFSLGGNLVLKYLGGREYLHNNVGRVSLNIEKAVAVSPPADLAASLAKLGDGFGPFYNRYFTRLLLKFIADHKKQVSDAAVGMFHKPPRGIVEFDEGYTAPNNGFAGAAEYYKHSSAAPILKNIEVPTLVIVSRDDPVVETGTFENPPGGALRVLLTNQGGHLGFLAKRGVDPDRRWMDWRIVDFVAT